MHRFTYHQKDWPAAIAYIKKNKKTIDTPTWAVKFKDDLSVKGKTIYFKEKQQIVPKEKVNAFLRKKIYDKKADIPFGRDSAFHVLKQVSVGCGRRAVMEFLRAQKSLGQVRPAVAKPKQKSGRKLKGYEVEVDLVFLKANDVKKMNTRIGNSLEKELSYICVMVEKTTGLTQCSFIKAPKNWKHHEEIKLKGQKIVMPVVKRQLANIAKALKVPQKDITVSMDAGKEFSKKQLEKLAKEVNIVAMGPSVEKRNQTAQRNLFRILKNRQADTIEQAVEKTQNMLNNTYNKHQKKTPNESAGIGIKAALSKYNDSRKTYIQGDSRNELEVGDYVRILVRKPKSGLEYKSYKDLNYTNEVYQIKTKTKKKPAKYRVNKRYFTIDRLLKSAPRDKESEKLIKDRKLEEEKEEEKFEEARVKDVEAEEERKKVEVVAGERRSTRSKRGGRRLQARMANLRKKAKKHTFGQDEDEE